MSIPLLMERVGTAVIGYHEEVAEEWLVTGGGHRFTCYKNDNGEWFQECHPDPKCIWCAGYGVTRIGASDVALRRFIRFQIGTRNGTLNASDRRVERERAAAEEWLVRHPDTAWHLALALARDERNELRTLAMHAHRRPLSAAQERYVHSMLIAAALPVEPHYVGNVGDNVSVEGVVTTAHRLSSHYGPGRPYVVVLRTGNAEQVTIITQAAWARSVAVGDELSVSGVVTAHEVDRRFGPQTVLNRARRNS